MALSPLRAHNSLVAKISTLGGRIRAARKRLGRNKNQMARELGTSWQHVDRWEKGKTKPSLPSLQRLAEYLGVSLDHLLGNEPGANDSEAFRVFLESYAPQDLSEAERRWLEAAPFGDREPSPGVYVDLLHRLRSVEGPRREKSGQRRKVDRPDLLARLGTTGD